MSDFAEWLLGLIKALFSAIWDFILDIVIEVLDLILSALLPVINAIPAPTFLGGFSSALQSIDPGVWFFASHFRFPECFAALGAAVLFRLARKAVTLFQW